MFEFFSSWWGGVVSTMGGLITLYTAFQLAQARFSKIYYDVFTVSPVQPRVPEGVSVVYKHSNRETEHLYETYFIVKNQIDASVSDDDFNSLPKFRIPKNCEVLEVSIFKQDGNSHCDPEINTEDGSVHLKNLTIPINGALSGYVLSTMPLKNELYCVHKSKKVVKRDYGSVRYDMLAVFLVSFLPLVFFTKQISTYIPAFREMVFTVQRYFGWPQSIDSFLVLILFGVIAFIITHVRFKLFPMSKSEKHFYYLKRRSNKARY